MLQKIVTIYTDGACSGNPGVGGWGAVLLWNGHEKELYGNDAFTTNNQMELLASIKALEALKAPCVVELYTDSAYVRNGITQWLDTWIANGWRTSSKTPVKNAQFWQTLAELNNKHKITWHWVKGHAGNEFNERADKLARRGIQEYKASVTISSNK
ncbi:ribonuclease HI [Bartonella sp. TP]|uniref:ribonuclease HI n=1 Tax=Bartonella sp. TP TaxID=3057550 RepID=UPI0025AF731F|nr:ribonuclease HI [Bartonella sp. TP]WJW80557.1 ribonuclease HI [Bartonella sp. TP]